MPISSYGYIPFGATYHVLHDLPAGSVVTIDFSHVMPFIWFNMALKEIKGLARRSDGIPSSAPWGDPPFSSGGAGGSSSFTSPAYIQSPRTPPISPLVAPVFGDVLYIDNLNTRGVLTTGSIRTYIGIVGSGLAELTFGGLGSPDLEIHNFNMTAAFLAHDYGPSDPAHDFVTLTAGPTYTFDISGSSVSPTSQINSTVDHVWIRQGNTVVDSSSPTAGIVIADFAGLASGVSPTNVIEITLTRNIIAPSALCIYAFMIGRQPLVGAQQLIDFYRYPIAVTDNVPGSPANFLSGRFIESMITPEFVIQKDVEMSPVRFRAHHGPKEAPNGPTPSTTYHQLLGKGTVSGSDTITVTLDDPVPAEGTLHVVFCTLDVDASTGTLDTLPLAPTDSNSISGWVANTSSRPLIGLARDDNTYEPGYTYPDPFKTIEVGSVARPCTTGDLVAGDTITVPFDHVTVPANFSITALIVWVASDFTIINQFGVPFFNNGDGYGSLGSNPKKLSWPIDFDDHPTPQGTGLMLTAMGAYPGQTGFNPTVGSLVGEMNGDVSIACSLYNVTANTEVDPGGTWPSDREILAGNYQFMHSLLHSPNPSKMDFKLKFRAYQDGAGPESPGTPSAAKEGLGRIVFRSHQE